MALLLRRKERDGLREQRRILSVRRDERMVRRHSGVLDDLRLWTDAYPPREAAEGVEFVYEGLSSLGNVGIVGLYATIMVSLGAMIRNVIPTAWSIVYVTLSDPLPLLQLIDVMEVCRKTNYP